MTAPEVSLREELKNIPKVELHLHFDGALRPKLLQEIAQKQGHSLGAKSLTEIERLAVISDPKGSLVEVLKAFDLIVPLLRREEACEMVAYEMCREAQSHGVRYFEVRYAPALSESVDFSMDDFMRAALKGLARGRKDFGVKSGFIVTMLRNLPRSQNERMFDLALRWKAQGVVAVDLANDEAMVGLKEYADIYQEARRQGLATVVHAGEVYPSPDLPVALDLGVSRIGHGVFLTRYKEILQEVARRQIPVEVNLTSNLRTAAVASYQEHPLPVFLETGVPVVLGTDDPGIFGIDLTGEYEMAQRCLGLSVGDLKKISQRSIDAILASSAEKDHLRRLFEQS